EHGAFVFFRLFCIPQQTRGMPRNVGQRRGRGYSPTKNGRKKYAGATKQVTGDGTGQAKVARMSFELTRKLATAGGTRVVVEAPNEAALLLACQAGDSNAFRRLFDSHKDRVYSLALYLTRDEAVANDITQQTFVTLLAKAKEFRGDAKLSTWLYRLVLNLY